MTTVDSIFDISTQKSKLWRKSHPNFDPDQKPTFSLIAHKPDSKNPKTLNARVFFRKGNFLCYKRKPEDQKPSGLMDLEWSRVEFKPTGEEEFKDDFKITMLLIKKRKMIRILLKGEEEQEAWRRGLEGVCCFKDFHVRYKAVEEIGSGSYASVRFF